MFVWYGVTDVFVFMLSVSGLCLAASATIPQPLIGKFKQSISFIHSSYNHKMFQFKKAAKTARFGAVNCRIGLWPSYFGT